MFKLLIVNFQFSLTLITCFIARKHVSSINFCSHFVDLRFMSHNSKKEQCFGMLRWKCAGVLTLLLPSRSLHVLIIRHTLQFFLIWVSAQIIPKVIVCVLPIKELHQQQVSWFFSRSTWWWTDPLPTILFPSLETKTDMSICILQVTSPLISINLLLHFLACILRNPRALSPVGYTRAKSQWAYVFLECQI